MSKNIEVAVTVWSTSQGWLADEFCQQAEIAESLGFHSFWLPENHFGDVRSIPSPLTLLAAVAARTSTIKLGSTSYLLPIRNPLQAAEEVAVLDQLSGGRVILGVGRGVQDAMFKAFELPTRDKRKRFQANLDIMINAWAGEPILIDDQQQPVYLAPLPIQRPHPPIWVAAFGPLALKQAGRLGMPYLASPVETLDVLVENYRHYQAMAAEANHDRIKTIPVMRTLFVTEDNSMATEVRAALAQSAGHNMRAKAASVDDWCIVGDRIYVRDKLTEYVERLGLTHLIARGRIPGVDNESQLKSHEQLLSVVGGL